MASAASGIIMVIQSTVVVVALIVWWSNLLILWCDWRPRTQDPALRTTPSQVPFGNLLRFIWVVGRAVMIVVIGALGRWGTGAWGMGHGALGMLKSMPKPAVLCDL